MCAIDGRLNCTNIALAYLHFWCIFSLPVESIAQLLNETRVQVQQLKVDTQTFIGENNDIISEIDSLIANLGDVHSNVNRVSGCGHMMFLQYYTCAQEEL